MRLRLMIVGFLTAGVMALPSTASADYYCVDFAGPPPPQGGQACAGSYNGSTGVQQALNQAALHGGTDYVVIGPYAYSTPGPGGFKYTGGDDVWVYGSGVTNITVPAPAAAPGTQTTYTGLDIEPQSGSSVWMGYLDVTLPAPVSGGANQHYVGIRSDAHSSITRVGVAAPNAAGLDALGVSMPSGELTGAEIGLPLSPLTEGVDAGSGGTGVNLITDSTIRAGRAVNYSSGTTGALELKRSTLIGGEVGLDLTGGPAQVTIESSIVELAGDGATGIDAEHANDSVSSETNVTADGVTIATKPGTANGVGIHVAASGANVDPDPPHDPLPPDAAAATLTNSIIDPRIATSIERISDDGASASVSVDYSDFDATKVVEDDNMGAGLGAITAGPNNISPPTGVDPLFVNPAVGDFHLSAGSPLLDQGDPAEPPLWLRDVDGDPRATVAGTCSPGRRDIGADEVVAPYPLGCQVPTGGGLFRPGEVPVTNPRIGARPAARKKCKKGRKLRRGRCVRKKKKR